MSTANYSINHNAVASASAEDIAVGCAVLKTTTGYLVASLANRTAQGRRSDGIALDSAAAGRAFRVAHDGLVDATHSGLATGAKDDLVYVADDGTLARSASPATGADVIGRCPGTNGDFHLNPGSSSDGGGAATPTGTGFPHVTAGVQDAAAKLVENTDVHASAAIAVTKIATGTAGQFLTVVAGPANAWGNVVSHIQFVANGTSLLGQSGVIRVDPNNTRDIIVTRKEDDSGDLVLISHWTPAAGKNELAIGNGQAIGTQVSRLVLSGADFVRTLAGSYTAWRAGSSGGVQFHSDTEDFGGGVGVIGIDNATTAPTTNPTAGIVLYVDSADNTLKYRKADGSTVTLSGSSGSTFADNVFEVTDNGDATKKLAFECSGITTGTTRTLTVPNASGTLPLLGLAQTFSALQTFSAIAASVTPAASGIVRLGGSGAVSQIVWNSDGAGNDRALLSTDTGGPSWTFGVQSALTGAVRAFSLTLDGWSALDIAHAGTTRARWTDAGLQVGSSSSDFGGGEGVIGLDNARTVPTTNPTSGVVMYVDPGDGHLKVRRADGTVVDLTP